MNSRAPAILDHLASLADTTRSRILLLLDRHELTVSELCGIMQLPQSTVSRHLKALADAGWVSARAEGTSHLYTMTREELDAAARRLWLLVREQVGPSAAAMQDQRRLQACSPSGARSRRSFSPRRPVSGIASATNCSAIASTSPRWPPSRTATWVVGDLGCGTGTGERRPRAVRRARDRGRRVGGHAPGGEEAARNSSTTSISGAASSKRCRSTTGARCGDVDARAASRAGARSRAGRGVARVLKPGGRVVLGRHAAARSRELSAADGTRVARVQRRAHAAAVEQQPVSSDVADRALPPDAKAKGPALFVATARKPRRTRKHEIGLARGPFIP